MALNKLCGSSERNLTSGGWDEASRSDPVGLSDIAMSRQSLRKVASPEKLPEFPKASVSILTNFTNFGRRLLVECF
jgi:hypothetical protein